MTTHPKAPRQRRADARQAPPARVRDLTRAGDGTALDERLILGTLVSELMIDTLARAYRLFEGDLVMYLVFGEIAHYNVSRALRGLAATDRLPPGSPLRELRKEPLMPCNALSISESTGIPRETVRRKVKALQERGWLRREAANRLTLAPQAVRRFQATGLELLQSFDRTAGHVQALRQHMGATPASAGPGTPPASAGSPAQADPAALPKRAG